MKFETWFQKLQDLAKERGYPINGEDPESYREYYNDGDSPATTLGMEMSYGDYEGENYN